jgi:hypothetical protein
VLEFGEAPWWANRDEIWYKPAIKSHVIGRLEHDGFIRIIKTVGYDFDFMCGLVYMLYMFGLFEVKQQHQDDICSDEKTDYGDGNIH